MHGKHSKVLAIALAAFSLASCATSRPEPMPAPIALPARAEPPFQKIGFASLRTSMTVQSDTADLIAKLKSQFHAVLSPDRAAFSLQQEELILSNGLPYRRVWVSYEDSATWSSHGACSQNIYAWFSSSGELAEVFVEELVCPI